MNLTIMPGAATEDVAQIESLVQNIDEYMTELNDVIKKLIPSGIETDWSEELLNKWTECYNGSVQNAMEGMLLSAKNLKMAIDAALEYNK